MSERVEIASVSGGMLTLSTPLHWTFQTSQSAEISKVSTAITRWAGVEHLWVQGGNGIDQYDGQKAGGVDVTNAAYSWIEDVQTDGTLTGMHVTLTGAYRCVVRDSHFHNAALYGFGEDNYGIVTRCGAADNLIENNIARYVDKPILFNNSGGGNVVGYNYADNEWSIDTQGDDGCQEVTIDCHCAFPHMELIEGNYAPHMGASNTHGNAGYLTFFRNYASTRGSSARGRWLRRDPDQRAPGVALPRHPARLVAFRIALAVGRLGPDSEGGQAPRAGRVGRLRLRDGQRSELHAERRRLQLLPRERRGVHVGHRVLQRDVPGEREVQVSRRPRFRSPADRPSAGGRAPRR